MTFRSILDPKFKYRDSASTDVRKTWERYRRLQRMKQAQGAKVVATIQPKERKQA